MLAKVITLFILIGLSRAEYPWTFDNDLFGGKYLTINDYIIHEIIHLRYYRHLPLTISVIKS